MRHSDPNDFPQIGGQGVGIRTLQTFLREGEREIACVYDDICSHSSTPHLFPIRGKAFYLEIAKMHASYVMVSGKAQEARQKRIRTMFGMSQSPSWDNERSFRKGKEHIMKHGETSHSYSYIQQVKPQMSAATERSANIGSVAERIDIGYHKSDLTSPNDVLPKYEGQEDTWSCYEGGIQKAARRMNASVDIALKSTRLAAKPVKARQPVIRGRIKTLDDHVRVWMRGEYRGVLIRKLRSIDYRKKARPPITNAEWNTEKHAVKRVFEAVNIVAHYLPGREPSESAPEELWEIALNEAYRELAEGKGRKTSMTLIKFNAKLKGIDFKCRDPRQS